MEDLCIFFAFSSNSFLKASILENISSPVVGPLCWVLRSTGIIATSDGTLLDFVGSFVDFEGDTCFGQVIFVD